MADDLVRAARAWIDDDPDPETEAAGRAMLESGDTGALAECFGRRLTFGTAGIRGALGPGPSRMNRALVRRVTAGLVATLAREVPGDGPLIVGYDGRTGSDVFAEDVARVATGAGLRVLRFPRVCPTPLLAYAVRVLRARGGVMITASHNPPGDNGYKVYGPDGAQIVSPLDQRISERIDQVASVRALPLGDVGAMVPGWVLEQYIADVLAMRVHGAKPDLRIVYTAMHGVGSATVRRVMADAEYEAFFEVPEQAEPDAAFPTVAFPNPEEPGALDRAFAVADAVGADLILANDPDADRIAVAIPSGAPGGGWRRLTGNEVGTLLAEDLLTHGHGGDRLVATTVVSTTLLAKIAQAHGAEYAETLTGFKWIAQAAMASPARFVMGFEEALGVSAGDVVRDKDGISAAVLVADLASSLAFRGKTLADAIDDLHRTHGVHTAGQVSLVFPGEAGLQRIREMTAALRASPWTELAGTAVTGTTDYAVPTGGLPATDLLAFALADGSRVLVRPSGTEPKLKVYVEVVVPVGAPGIAPARAEAAERLRALEADVRARLA